MKSFLYGIGCCLAGVRLSFMLFVCFLLCAIEMTKKTQYDIMSIFAWSHVELNLPSSDDYDPGKRRVSKIWADGQHACDEVTFVDDGRVVGPSQVLTTQVTIGTLVLVSNIAAAKKLPVSDVVSVKGMAPGLGLCSTLILDSIADSLLRRSGTRARLVLYGCGALLGRVSCTRTKRLRNGPGTLSTCASRMTF
jgi:hypothetical protein